jgi:FAD/FMN-containing dehydrogenase
MIASGWGCYPRVDAELRFPAMAADCAPLLAVPGTLIPRGLGRSYGDSSLAPRMLCTRHLDLLQSFDDASGVLECAAGTPLAELLRVFVPRGWFLPVTPGTRFVTIGGAVASDVHGKNHHLDGSFSRHLTHVDLLLGNGEQVRASPTEHAELFAATCGGMGLTGLILSAGIRLRRIAGSEIVETTLKLPGLDSVLAAFDAHASATYSVAWIDCLARGAALGRSLLMLGEHAADGPLRVQPHAPRPVPLDLLPVPMSRATGRAFNRLHYHRVRSPRSTRRVPLERFFYPLDALADWNRLYGRAGLLQYQFVLPREAGARGLREVLERIAGSGAGAFLAVLKAFGPGNAHPLSFPREGWTLAVDFKAEPAVFALLDALDRIVLDHGGRHYLAKDARMSAATFRAGYPHWEEFEAVRERWHAAGKFASAQSRRLGLQ